MDAYNSEYVGGRLQNIRSSKYGLRKVPKSMEQLLGGFQAPVPSVIVDGGKKKKQTKFKRTAKGAGIVGTIAKTVDGIASYLGLGKEINMKQLSEKIKKERTRFRSMMNKGATQTKKMMVRGGSTQKVANEEKKRHQDVMKQGLKKAIAHHTLMALKEFNDRLTK